MADKNTGGHWNRGHVSNKLLRYFKKKLKCKTMLDVGCGMGFNVALASERHGYKAYGLEGDSEALENPLCENLYKHDFENDGVVTIKEIPDDIDLIWSVSVSEHIKEDKVANYIDIFKRGKYIVFTWCPIGFPGFHHVNCQEAPYWIKKFQDIGYKLDDELTRVVKKQSDLVMVKAPHWRPGDHNKKEVSKMYLRKWGLCFTRI